jgi:uncharacterized protein YkwD
MRSPSPLATVVVLTLALALVAAEGAGQAGGAGTRAVRIVQANAVEAPSVAQLNAVRRAHGLRPLRWSAQLARAARTHAASMGSRGYFTHSSADGTPFQHRIGRYYRPAARHLVVGETLYWRSPTAPPSDVITQWLASPVHRRILLDPEWREIGLEAVFVPAAGGVFGRRAVTIVVADFGAVR